MFRIGLPDSVEVLVGPKLLARVCQEAPGIRFRFYSTDARRLLDEIDADNIDLGVGIGTFPEGQMHHKRRILATETYLCMFNAENRSEPSDLPQGLRAAAARADEPAQGGARRGRRCPRQARAPRQIALTTPRFVAVPFLVAGAP